MSNHEVTRADEFELRDLSVNEEPSRVNEEPVLEENGSNRVTMLDEKWKQLLAIFLVTILLVVIVVIPVFIAYEDPNECRCAVKDNLPQTEGDISVVTSAVQTTCDKGSSNHCLAYCMTLAEMNPEMFEKRVCDVLPDVTSYPGALYYWDCAKNEWREARPFRKVCCHNSAPILCSKDKTV